MKQFSTLILPIICTIGALAWLIESLTVGRGIISQYIGPFIVIVLLAGTWYRVGTQRRK